MAKVWSSESAMDNFHLPGEIRITHNGEQVFIGKLSKISEIDIY